MKMMKTFLLAVALLLGAVQAWAQNGTITGTVTANNEPLIGASVIVVGSITGSTTDATGKYSISIKPGTYKLRISFIGYETQDQTVTVTAGQTTTLDVTMVEGALVGQEVIISASRRPEKLTEAPATIVTFGAKEISELPSFNVGELLARQKGVDYVRSGVLGVGINVRGFNSAFNPKNLQMNDGRLSTLIATGLPLGALSTVVKEDIERVEVVLGPSSALYGPNAHNGLVNTISKDPRTSQGTTVALGVGNQSVMSARLRHAQVLSKKFAFKLSAEYTEGEEFPYTDTVYFNNTAFPTFTGGAVPARFSAVPELDLDRRFNSLRGEAALYYSVTDNSDIILAYGGSNSNNIGVTNAGRNQIKDWQIHYLHLRYVSPRLFAQVYHTISKTDDTYAMNQYTQNYISFRDAGFSDADARRRAMKEQWFGISPTVGVALNRGALFRDDSRRWNGEVQYNNNFAGFDIIVGTQFQRDIAQSYNTYLLDANGAIVIDQVGFYGQIERPLGNGFKATVAARADNHDLYGFNFIPKAAITKTFKSGTARITYGQGISAPTILNLEANIFGGLLLGNGSGFTLNDGTQIPGLKVEKISTFEVGYKGTVGKNLFIDVNAYHNTSRDFLSPALNIATNGRTVTQRGGVPMNQVIPGTPATGAPLVLTYLNFGNVQTYGADLGITYAFTPQLSATLNYSRFGYSLDKNDLANDGNKDGRVTDLDLPINTPANKASFLVNYSSSKWFGSVFTRWVERYNFFSGIHVASETIPELGIRENARFGRTFNYGPLGGFVNVDVSAGYRFGKVVTLSGQITNLFNARVYEFVGSPIIGRLYSLELKVNIPAIGSKK